MARPISISALTALELAPPDLVSIAAAAGYSHVGLRLDARAYGVFVKGVTGAFCVNGTCAFAYTGNMLWQGDFTAGLIFAF